MHTETLSKDVPFMSEIKPSIPLMSVSLNAVRSRSICAFSAGRTRLRHSDSKSAFLSAAMYVLYRAAQPSFSISSVGSM